MEFFLFYGMRRRQGPLLGWQEAVVRVCRVARTSGATGRWERKLAGDPYRGGQALIKVQQKPWV